MRNLIRTALVIGTLGTSMVVFADTPKDDKTEAKDTKDTKDTKAAPKTDAKTAPKTDTKTKTAPKTEKAAPKTDKAAPAPAPSK